MPTFPSLPSFLPKYRHFLQIEFLSVVVCVVFIVRWKKTHHDWSVIRLFLLSTIFFRCCKSVRGDNDFRRRYLFESTCFSCFSRKIVPIALKSKGIHTVRLDRFYFLTRQTFFTLSHFFLATACRQKMPTRWKKYFCRRICRRVQAIVNLAVFKSTKNEPRNSTQKAWQNSRDMV